MSDDADLTALIGHTQATVLDVREINGLLLEELRARNTAPDVRTVLLTPTQTVAYDQQSVEEQSRSLGVLNPNPVAIYWATGGGSASAAARAISQPPNSLLVLPLLVAGVEFSVDPAALAGSNAVLFVMRFASVQPCFLGKM